jgi:hypothetical protein
MVNTILVSSANKIDLDFTLIFCDKSFVLKRKNKGPKTGPCRTLCFVNPDLNMPCD